MTHCSNKYQKIILLKNHSFFVLPQTLKGAKKEIIFQKSPLEPVPVLYREDLGVKNKIAYPNPLPLKGNPFAHSTLDPFRDKRASEGKYQFIPGMTLKNLRAKTKLCHTPQTNNNNQIVNLNIFYYKIKIDKF